MFWPGEFHGLYSPWVAKSWTRLSDFLFHPLGTIRPRTCHEPDESCCLTPYISNGLVSLLIFLPALPSLSDFKPLRPQGFPDDLVVKNLPANAGDRGSIPGSGRSSGEGNGNPLQSSRLESPMEGGAWWTMVHGVTKSRTQLSD